MHAFIPTCAYIHSHTHIMHVSIHWLTVNNFIIYTFFFSFNISFSPSQPKKKKESSEQNLGRRDNFFPRFFLQEFLNSFDCTVSLPFWTTLSFSSAQKYLRSNSLIILLVHANLVLSILTYQYLRCSDHVKLKLIFRHWLLSLCLSLSLIRQLCSVFQCCYKTLFLTYANQATFQSVENHLQNPQTFAIYNNKSSDHLIGSG